MRKGSEDVGGNDIRGRKEGGTKPVRCSKDEEV